MADVTLRLRVDGQAAVVGGIDQVTSALDRNVQAADRDALALQRNAAAVEQLKNQRSLGVLSMREYETQMGRLAAQQSAATQAASAQAAELDALRSKFDPAYAGAQRLTAEQQQLKRALDAGVISQQRYTELLGQMTRASATAGVSMGQIAQATRQLPLQMQDVFVSLQAGQNPLTVFVQQGSQIAGSYGGAGLALRSVGSYLVGLVNPFTVAAAAAGVLAVAYNQGSKEADAFRAALLTTGNAAGASTNQLAGLAAAMGQGFGNTVGKGAEVLAQFAASGQVGRASLQDFASTAVIAEKAFGTAIKDIAKNFADLGKDPVGASAKLNESMNYLTASTYAQIKAAVDLGQESKAAALAQDAYSSALKGRSAEMLASMGTIEKAWAGVTSAAKEAWDAMLGVGRPVTVSSQIGMAQKNLEAALEKRKKISDDSAFAPGLDKDIAKLKESVGYLTELDRIQKRAGDSAAERVAKEQAGIQAQKDGLKYLGDEQKMRNDIAQQTATMRKAGYDEAAIQERIAAIKASYDKKGSKAQEISEYDKLNKRISEFAALQTAALDADSKLTDGQRLAVRVTQDMAAAGAKLNATDKQRLQTALDAAQAIEQRNIVEKEVAKLMDDSVKLQATAVNQAQKSIDSIQQQATAEREATASISLTKAAIAELSAAKYDDSAATKERLANTMAEAGESELLIKKYREEAQALRDLAVAKRERGGAETANDLAKVGLEQAKRLSGVAQTAAAPMADFGNTLRDALGGAFSEMGKMVNAMTTLNTLAQQYAAEMEVIEKLRNSGDSKNIETAHKNEIALVKKQEQAQIGAYASMAGAAASYFGKQTAAYKVLHGAEVALRTYQLVMSAQTAAKDLAGIAAKVTAWLAGDAAITTSAATSAGVMDGILTALGFKTAAVGVANQANGDPYSAFPRMAAMAAMMAGLGFLVGGGSKDAGPAPTNSGTGTVFGDVNAKSESLAKSLDILNATQDVALSYSRAMAASLRSIEASMGGVANVWLRTGGATGLTGSIATGKMDTGLSSFMNVGNSLLGSFGRVLSGITTSLFGKKVSITGSGLTANAQSLGGILDSGFQGFNYADVNTKKKVLGYTYSNKTSERRSDLDPALERQISAVFSGIGSAVGTAADLLGQDMSGVEQRLRGYVVNLGRIDLKGLDGKQIAERLSAVFGQQADLIAQSVIPGFESLTQVGEGYFETLARVANEFEVVSTYTRRLGGVMGATGLDAAKLSDSLVGLFGGVDGYQTALSDYYQAFYSDAERTAMTSAELQNAFKGLNVSMPASEKAFRDLVNAQDLTTEAGRSAYVALIQLSPAFKTVSDAAAQAAQAIADERASLQDQLDQALGNTATLRSRELAALDPSNRALQERLYRLADEKAAYEASKSASDAALSGVQKSVDAERKLAQTRISTAQEQVNTLKSVFGALDSGIKGLTSSTDAAAQAGRSFIDRALATAQATGYLPDAQALQEAISGATQGLSARVYASAAEQQADRLSLAAKLAALQSLTGTQLSNAEQILKSNQDQLTTLDSILTSAQSQVDALRGIDAGIKSIPTALAVFAAALATEQQGADKLAKVSGFASGGYHRGGLRLVGENGPELEVTGPARIYSAEQTRSMLASGNGQRDTQRLESLVLALTQEVQRLQALTQAGNRELRRTADATNGNPEQPMLVQTL